MRTLALLITCCLSASSVQAQLSCPSDSLFQELIENSEEFRLQQEKFEEGYRLQIENPGRSLDELYTLPVVIHIFHSGQSQGSTENPSDSEVHNVINGANQRLAHTQPQAPDYDNPYYGVTTDIEFCISDVDPDGNSTTGILRYNDPDLAEGEYPDLYPLFDSYKWDITKYTNIFIVTLTEAGGVYISGSYDFTIYNAGSFWDGLVAHEQGHYFSLAHTFSYSCPNDDCLTDGDKVCDTPPKFESGMQGSTCENQSNSCFTDDDDASTNNPYRPVIQGGLGDQDDMLDNYMDYTFNCWDAFTVGQKERMRFNISSQRTSNVAHASIACSGPQDIFGCTDLNAHNFNPDATIDDGSCETCNDGIQNGDETGIDCGGDLCNTCPLPCDGIIGISAYVTCTNETIQQLEICPSSLDNGSFGYEIPALGVNDPGLYFVNDCWFSHSWNVESEDLIPGDVVILHFSNGCDTTLLIDFSQACEPSVDIYGCTDPSAHNYDPEATEDDGSCETCNDGIQNGDESGIDCGGALCEECPSPCSEITELSAHIYCVSGFNYYEYCVNSTDNGYVTRIQVPAIGYDESGNFFFNCATGSLAESLNPGDVIILTFANGCDTTLAFDFTDACDEIEGCTDTNSHNYNPDATEDDGSCETCEDGIMNGDETGIDCGGNLCESCPPECEFFDGFEVYVECYEFDGVQYDKLIFCTNWQVNIPLGYEISSAGISEPGPIYYPGDYCHTIYLEPVEASLIQEGDVVIFYHSFDDCEASFDIDFTDQCEPDFDIYGCTDPSAHNYNSDATEDDGSCETCFDGIQNGDEIGVDCGGILCDPCTVECPDLDVSLQNPICIGGGGALTYLYEATSDLGGTYYVYSYFSNSTFGPFPYNQVHSFSENENNAPSHVYDIIDANDQNCKVTVEWDNPCYSDDIYGCTEPSAHNYNANATQDDGSCETCFDGIQNGDETDVDCGGTLCQPCEVEPTCFDNNFCDDPMGISSANDLGVLVTVSPDGTGGCAGVGDPFTCIAGCNLYADEIEENVNCIGTNDPIVWYSFTTDANAAKANIVVTSEDFNAPVFQLFLAQDGTCADLVPTGNCAVGSGGEASITALDVSASQVYYIALGGISTIGGDFELCISVLEDLSACALSADITVAGRSLGGSLEGPFFPGEVVSICMNLNTYTPVGNGCQWFQGLVPTFGNGWDPSSFDGNGMPLNATIGGSEFPAPSPIGTAAQWDWFDDVTYHHDNCFYNVGDFDGNGTLDICHALYDEDCAGSGLTGGSAGPCWQDVPGTQLPPGWFAYGIQGHCSINGHPTVDYGDGNSCSSTMGPWNFCFDLTVRDYPDCQEDPTTRDLSLGFVMFSDGETGAWTGGASICANDGPVKVRLPFCCQELSNLSEIHEPICSDGLFRWLLDYPGVDYWTWTVYSDSVSGTSEGEGPNGTDILDNLVNTGVSSEVVTYTFLGYSGGCPSVIWEVDVEVLAMNDVQSSTGIFCPEEFIIGIPWGNITITSPGTYAQEFDTDPQGCPVDSIKLFESFPIVSPGVIDTVICGQSFEYEGVNYSRSGSYGLLYQNGSNNGCDSSAILNLELVYLEAEVVSSCENSSLVLSANILSDITENSILSYIWRTNGNVVSTDSSWSPMVEGAYSLEIMVESDNTSCIFPLQVDAWTIDISEELIADCRVCRIMEVNLDVTDCDSVGMFNVVLDMDLSEMNSEQFVVVGNGVNYGNFSYTELPIELGPFDGNEEVNWEFFVFDILNPDCGGDAETGIVTCNPSGVFTPSGIVKLKVRYDSGRPYFIPPEPNLDFTLWDTNGQLLTQMKLLDQESMVYLDQYTQQAGLVIIRLSGDDSEYVAKAVITR